MNITIAGRVRWSQSDYFLHAVLLHPILGFPHLPNPTLSPGHEHLYSPSLHKLLGKLSCNFLNIHSGLTKNILKLFFGCWLPLVMFSLKIIPHWFWGGSTMTGSFPLWFFFLIRHTLTSRQLAGVIVMLRNEVHQSCSHNSCCPPKQPDLTLAKSC